MKIFLLFVCLGLLSLNAYPQSKLVKAGKATKVGGTTDRKSTPKTSKSTTTPRIKTIVNQDPNAKYVTLGYMAISGVSFANIDNDGNIIDDYGANLYASEVKYLKPTVFYKGLASTEKKITLYVKIIAEDGTIKSGTDSPNGYTYKYDLTVKPGSGQSEQLLGWGNNSGGSYSAGQYSYEIWYDGNILFQKGLRLYSGSTPLVNSKILKISSISFANQDEKGKVISDFGEPLYDGELKYITPKIYFDGLCATDQKVTLLYRIYHVSGTMSKGAGSPIGFSSKQEIVVKPGANNAIISGWGNETGSYYKEGIHKYELWLDGEKIYETTFTVKKREAESPYLTVDGKAALSKSFGVSGGTETFYVKTNASSWDTWGVPSWCEIKNKTAASFTLYCKPNSAAERKDYMKVRIADKDVRIDIYQK